MDVTAEDFRRHYAELSDEALLEIPAGDLVAIAQTCLAEELARRGLDEPVIEEEDEAEATLAPGTETPVEEELTCVVEYDHMDEAELARGLLEGASIAASIETEPDVVRLMVPSAMVEQALQILAAPLSDEELAAQAEAAENPDLD